MAAGQIIELEGVYAGQAISSDVHLEAIVKHSQKINIEAYAVVLLRSKFRDSKDQLWTRGICICEADGDRLGLSIGVGTKFTTACISVVGYLPESLRLRPKRLEQSCSLQVGAAVCITRFDDSSNNNYMVASDTFPFIYEWLFAIIAAYVISCYDRIYSLTLSFMGLEVEF